MCFTLLVSSSIYKWCQSGHPFDYITGDDQSSADGDDGIDYQELCQTVVQNGKENLCLKKEKSWLEDTVINLIKKLDDGRKKEANTSDLKKENERLVVQIEVLEKHVKNEKARSSDLNAKLEHHYKTVRMLTGSKELDKILSLGRQDQTPRDDDQSSADGDDGIDYQELCQTVVQNGKENLCLKKEKSWLEDTVINLIKKLDDGRKKEANTSDLKKDNERLVVQIEVLEKHVKNEKARSSDLNAKLEHHYKTVRMLTGSKELDKILSLGRQDQTPRGLGYTGYGKSDP
ncbi:hypothetical protein F2Q69_00052824 [Brassica cretica]|uniref:Uncharacterized protein n=1 Tax=Brassica cretica TaxID=69181 RepID=A0A8S9N454_BRACR|nr:hypothetical protein F2Q69_00052824 [Brassica cretica]